MESLSYVALFCIIAFGMLMIIVLVRLIYTTFDDWRCEIQPGYACVIRKEFIKAHSRVIPTGTPANAWYSMTVPVPDRWILAIRLGEQYAQGGVPKELFDSVEVGDEVALHFYHGRFTNKPHVQEILLFEEAPTNPGIPNKQSSTKKVIECSKASLKEN